MKTTFYEKEEDNWKFFHFFATSIHFLSSNKQKN